MKICEIRLTTLTFKGNSACLSCSCTWPLWKEHLHWLCCTAYHLHFMLSEQSLQFKFCPPYLVLAQCSSTFCIYHVSSLAVTVSMMKKSKVKKCFTVLMYSTASSLKILHWRSSAYHLSNKWRVCNTKNNVKEKKIPGRICISRNVMAWSWGGTAPQLRT